MNNLIKINYETENPTVSGRELHKALDNCNSFEEFFVKVCEEKNNCGVDELKKLISIVNDIHYRAKYGNSTIVYLCDCITTEKLLPCKSADPRRQIEKEIQNEIINNFNKIFPNMKFVGQEVTVNGVGRIDILAMQGNQYVIIELKCGSKNPNAQLIAYAKNYDNPILIGITENELSSDQKLSNIEYLTFNAVKNRVDIWTS